MNGDPERRVEGGEPASASEVPAQEEAFREAMEEQSPDGRPPTESVRRESRALFIGGLAIVMALVLAALLWRGGWLPAVLGLVLMLGFVVLAAWPAWNAGAERKIEERRVTDQAKEHRDAAGRPV